MTLSRTANRRAAAPGLQVEDVASIRCRPKDRACLPRQVDATVALTRAALNACAFIRRRTTARRSSPSSSPPASSDSFRHAVVRWRLRYQLPPAATRAKQRSFPNEGPRSEHRRSDRGRRHSPFTARQSSSPLALPLRDAVGRDGERPTGTRCRLHSAHSSSPPPPPHCHLSLLFSGCACQAQSYSYLQACNSHVHSRVPPCY